MHARTFAAFLFVAAVAVATDGRARAQESPAPQASAASDASPSASPDVADPAIVARAKDVLEQVAAGTLDRKQLDTDFSARFSDDNAKALAAQVGPLGDIVAFAYVRKVDDDPMTIYTFKVRFKTGIGLAWSLGLDPDGKIGRFTLKPG